LRSADMALSDSLMTSDRTQAQTRRRETLVGIALGVALGTSIVMVLGLVVSPHPVGRAAAVGFTEDYHTQSDLVLVQDAFDTWESGGFNGELARENLQRMWSQDAVFDFSANINEPLYTLHRGHGDLLTFFQNLLALKFEHFKPTIFKGPHGTVVAKTMYNNVLVSTGARGLPQADFLEFRVHNGKIAYCKVFWGNQKQDSDLWATETIGPVKDAVRAWAAGQLLDTKAVGNFFADDVTLDATANVMGTDMYKVYGGLDGVATFTKFLTSFEFANFVPTFFPGPQPDTVMAVLSYELTYKPTGKSADTGITDIIMYKVANQKIKYMKFFWGQPEQMELIMN
jgi:hypothetical protein